MDTHLHPHERTLRVELAANNLVKIDIQGRVLDGPTHAVNPACFTVHGAIHGGLPRAHCVMHTHTTAGTAVAQKCTRDAPQLNPQLDAGEDLFEALVRQIDRPDTSYQQ